MKVWITRARPGAEATAARLTALGFTPVIAPLLKVRPLHAEIDLVGVDALVFTSINAVAAFTTLSLARDHRVFTVGDATAGAASEAGFSSVRSADGDLTALAALIRADGQGLTLLHIAAAQPAGDLAALVGDTAQVRTVRVYETVETDAGPTEPWDAVLIHSPRAARALASAAPDVADRLACAISEAAAAPLAPLGFAEVRIAAAPTEDTLLAALGKPGPAV
ncbi:uroporphyrinogen-III synthase [Brevundimonas bacteroides]|uniref:uroporphyrinogen-III synthase n=1 Tax=Brevundimonas bacteroides TaxID=74311 RepID=UPI000495EC17|nr:uroporphyrinogen-III synthase [Brevundimonas bacteroides]